MAGIREVFTLVDNFSSTFNLFNSASKSAMANAEGLGADLDNISAGAMDGATNGMRSFDDATRGAGSSVRQVAEEQNKLTQATKATAAATTSWMGALKGVVATIGGGALVKSFLDTSDTMSQITAKFNLITDSAEEAARLQNDIFAAAQRSRGAYEDMANTVTKLRQNAGAAFGNNAEAIRFTENLNKMFKLAGASQAEMSSASLQLTQALGSGALRGEEFRAVFEAAPGVIQKIADEMQVDIGAMKDLAAEGKITADIVKNAMLNATDDIANDFNSLPMTLADIIQSGKNTIQMALQDSFGEWSKFLNSDEMQATIQDVTQAIVVMAQMGGDALVAIGHAFTWVHDNIDKLVPILDVAVAAFLVFKAVSVGAAISSAAAWAVANWPLLLIIGVVAGAIVAAQNMGKSFGDAGRLIGQVFGFLYAFGYNLVADAWNLIATFAEFFANVFNDPLGAILHLFHGVFDTILGIVETVAHAIDTLLHTNMGAAVASFRSNLQTAVDNEYGEQKITIDRMEKYSGNSTRDLMSEFGDVGAGLGQKLDNLTAGLGDLTGYTDITSNAVAGAGQVNEVESVGSIKNDVKLSDEDLKVYRDIAEAKYMQKIEVKTLSPNVVVNVDKGSNITDDELAEKLSARLLSEAQSHTSIAYS